ncbi:MAG: hypothetical protein ACAI44_21505 [Candidatus Sericytochromatia bacterium]
MCTPPSIGSGQQPLRQTYQNLKRDGIDKAELKQLADQALLDGSLDTDEKAVFKDIVKSQGAIAKADLNGLPPQVQALLKDLGDLKQQVSQAAQRGGDDDYVRNTISDRHLELATPQQKAGMIVNLLDGFTGDEDEQTILKILRSPGTDDTLAALKAMGHLEWLFDDVNGSEYKELLKIDAREIRAHQGLPPKPAPPVPAQPAAPQAQAPALVQPPPTVPPPVQPPVQPAASQPHILTEGIGNRRTNTPIDRILERSNPPLSPARQRMLTELDQVMGSVQAEGKYGKGRNIFTGTEWDPAANKPKSGGTSCGLLPGVMLNHMGLVAPLEGHPIAGCGTNGVRDEAQALGFGIWQESDGKLRPKPGDIYVLCNDKGQPDDDGVTHIGVVLENDKSDPAKGDVWVTADAGQGSFDKQEAKEVLRRLVKDDKGRLYLDGPVDPVPRRVGGWADIDRLFLVKKASEHPGQIDAAELKQLGELAMLDGQLNETEVQIFKKLAGRKPGFDAEVVQSLPEAVRKMWGS